MTPRRPGRPPVDDDDDSVYVHLTLAAKQYDRLCREALREEISVAALIRRELDRIKHQKP